MYTKQVVYSWGIGNNFQGWKRFKHTMRDPNSLINMHSSFSATNPYIGKFVDGRNVYTVEGIDPMNNIPFDHSFLESGRIGINLPPGDIYEIEANIYSDITHYNHSTFDINIATGAAENNSQESTSFGYLGVADYKQSRYETVFSTFQNALKPYNNNFWTTDGNLKISNAFVMPNLPDSFNGFNIQIGPGNSDNVFNRDLCAENNIGSYNGINVPRVCDTYYRLSLIHI